MSDAVLVVLTPGEFAALTAYARRSGRDAGELMREAFLDYVSQGAFVPTAAQVRAWLRAHNWTPEPPGAAGSIWHGGIVGNQGVAVPHEEGDAMFIHGAVERIACFEIRSLAEMVLEMLVLPEEEAGDER